MDFLHIALVIAVYELVQTVMEKTVGRLIRRFERPERKVLWRYDPLPKVRTFRSWLCHTWRDVWHDTLFLETCVHTGFRICGVRRDQWVFRPAFFTRP